MKRIVTLLVVTFGFAITANAQDTMTDKAVKTIVLEQTPGEFTQKTLTLPSGTYIFEIANNGIDHNVGFVLVEKGKDISKAENHIQTAYVTAPVGTNKTQKSKPTELTKGEYVYFCPLNPTATDNTLIVE